MKTIVTSLFAGTVGTLLLAVLIVLCVGACGDNSQPGGQLGDACALDGDCETTLCVDSFLNGVVVTDGICTDSCNSDADCADEGGVCLRYVWTGESYCYAVCESNEDCRDGWECFDVGHSAACIPVI